LPPRFHYRQAFIEVATVLLSPQRESTRLPSTESITQRQEEIDSWCFSISLLVAVLGPSLEEMATDGDSSTTPAFHMTPSNDHDYDDDDDDLVVRVKAHHQTWSCQIQAKLLENNSVSLGGIDQATQNVNITTNQPATVQTQRRLRRVVEELSKRSYFANVLVMNIVVLTWLLHVVWTGPFKKDWSRSDMIQIPPFWQNKINLLKSSRKNQEWNHLVSSKTNTNKTSHPHEKTKSQHSTLPVVQSRPSFPSFLDYHSDKQETTSPLLVSYDGRSLLINGERILLLGGSIHPGWRVTQYGWEHALDEAIGQGLNLITLYIFWNSHQVYPDDDIDWNFPTRSIHHPNNDDNDDDTEWSLASAIRSAAKRGLFVHIRIGPYACAEYNNGGIPEWLSLQHPNMVFRSFDFDWMSAMEQFLNQTVTYLRSHQLWAYQGGNILLAQVENELPWSQLYADWSGTVAQQLEPQVTWTMCNGLSAPNTILTCNCIGGGCSQFLEHHGDNGRIQRDMPALLTEFEGGFQTWGETSDHPSAYFWGMNARSMARHALKWFARGGSHLNHYMWHGGYNRGRSAGNGITNMYASDVSLCSSGERHEPKYSHFQDMHRALANVANVLLDSPSALFHSHIVEYWNNETGTWQAGSEQRLFVYPPPAGTAGASMTRDAKDVVIFLENDSSNDVLVRLPTWGKEYSISSSSSNNDLQIQSIRMAPESVMLLVNGKILFDSATINPEHMKFRRRMNATIANPLSWSTWSEPIGAPVNDSQTIQASRPKEQTALNIEGKAADSDYAWYETDFVLNASSTRGSLYIDSRRAMAFVVYVDGLFAGAVHNIDTNRFGNVTIPIDMDLALSAGNHTLSLLSESLGYHNTAPGSQQAKTKGITGDVLLVTYNGPGDVGHIDGTNETTVKTTVQSLVDGREWRSFPGLHGSSKMLQSSKVVTKKARAQAQSERFLGNGEPEDPMPMFSPPTWSSVLFRTPDYDPTTAALFLQITRGRGHLWLNGNDLGRYWNITRGDTDKYSQQFYFLPYDFLDNDDGLNEILLFDALGGNVDDVGSTMSDRNSSRRLVLSWIEASKTPTLIDLVDFPSACL
jgi:hypothetical protein